MQRRPARRAASTGDSVELRARPRRTDPACAPGHDGEKAAFDGLPIRFDSDARGYREIGARSFDALAGVPLKRYVLWVREHDTVVELERTEDHVRQILADAEGRVAVRVPERTARDSGLNRKALSESATRIGGLVAATVLIAVTLALGLSHTHRQRHEIALLRSQGASARTVLAVYTVEVAVLVIAASAAGCAVAVIVLELGLTSLLAAAFETHAKSDAALAFETSAATIVATMAGLGACGIAGALAAATGAARRDPGQRLQLR